MNIDITHHQKLIIIGSGPAGYTAAIYAARANLSPVLFTGINPGGQLINTSTIENWPGNFPVITGTDLMNKMHKHAKLFNTTIVPEEIIKVRFNQIPFLLISDTHKKYTSDAVVIATGATAKSLGLPSEKKFMGRGVSSCAICDGFFYKNKNVAIVGGGNSAIEEALYLSNIAKEVHLIHRRENLRAEKILISRLLKKVKENSIIFHKNSIVHKILGDKTGVTGINIISTNNMLEKNYNINVSGVFIAIGHTPNTKIFLNQIKMKNDYITIKSGINGNYTQTSIPGIFAAGDVIDHVYKQAITASSSGCMAALDAEKYLDKVSNSI
ncbi:thioredoxin-disulfide reductase [Buchnera aphidicola (Melaphis rhois)]|uniref:Thioredoxin reductase n=1 Tax=Buchnera aphidicola subsp. Melaphis rhois TaxID=118103 RepID=A0A4D6Y2J7_BUCMH|nr:thioredoxin-disulfide reductase [Buchnera aphidicola (Melaphis rhois)]